MATVTAMTIDDNDDDEKHQSARLCRCIFWIEFKWSAFMAIVDWAHPQ